MKFEPAQSKSKFIKVPHAGDIEMNYLIETIKHFRKFRWSPNKWKSQAALVEKSSNASAPFYGQDFDSSRFIIVENAWDHQLCDICFATISDSNPETFESDEDSLICKNCYTLFIKPERIEEVLENLPVIEK